MEELFLTDNEGKRRRALNVKCNGCQQFFLKRKNWVKEVNYCTRECKSLNSRQNIEYTCVYCNNVFISDKSRIKGSKSGLLFCSRKCKDLAQKVDSGFDKLWPSHYNDGYSEYRSRAFENYPHECEYCKYNECTKVLEVHHIDSDRLNGKLENLIILCPTHHAAISRNYATLGKDRIYKWISMKY